MATAAQRKAFAGKLGQISIDFVNLEEATLRESLELLLELRDALAGHLTGSEFDQFRVAEQQKALDAIIADYEEQARAMANGAAKKSYKLGGQSVIDPLKAAKVKVSFFRPSKAQVEVLAQFSADLIGGVSDDMRTKINRSIRMNALGGNSSLDAMKEITDIMFGPGKLPTPKTKRPVKGVAYEAERILRTETNRAYSMASFDQQEKLAQDVPGLQKQWIATADSRTRISHLVAHGQIVDVDEPFRLNGSELMFPLDPSGPPEQTINCRCRSITVIPEIGPLETPLDKDIEDERAERGKVKPRKVKLPKEGDIREGLVNVAKADRLDKQSIKWRDSLTNEQKKIVREWSGAGYKNIRFNIINGQIGERERDFLAALDKAPSVSGTVWRGAEVFVGDYERAIGTTIEWDGPSSATLNASTAGDFGDTIFEINAAGKNGKYISAGSTYFGRGEGLEEWELIFKPKSRFRVLGVQYDQTFGGEFGRDTRTVIQLEEV